jgi:predicted nucleotidyltransferase
MPNLYKITTQKGKIIGSFSEGELFSVEYHDIFDFPLNIRELIRWRAGETAKVPKTNKNILNKNGYYFLEGKEGIVYKRMLRSRLSAKKMAIAKRASKIMSYVPGIKMVAVTGSLAMENATEEGDIDLMIVTKSGSLWTTRLLTYFTLRLFGFQLRKPNDRNQKDKLCLNIWLDESNLRWNSNANLFTAHEIAQIVPILNKDKTYDKFLSQNRWILEYWPNSVRISTRKLESTPRSKPGLLERVLYKLQLMHMKSKRTRETITPTRALFHPQDLSVFVLSRFSSGFGA